ncbi:MAG: Lrp/AsnC family transcriptional regulator [Hyphomicrobiales bacterium]|nr:MAG: Lrp/AsnC family transcriptional regulator [Hyphomicrobiales bacterium]
MNFQPRAFLDEIDKLLIDKWQRDFPLVHYPFTALGVPLGLSEDDVLLRLERMIAEGTATRLGAVLAPNTLGASTLAAMAVPDERLDEVVERVNSYPGVNHNYQREHDLNLWFVVTGADRDAVDATLAGIEEDTGLAVLDLPIECAYHIDLGFPIDGLKASRAKDWKAQCSPDTSVITAQDRGLIRAIEDGLPLVDRPYAAIAKRLGTSEDHVIARLQVLIGAGVVRRLGIVVRHHSVGFSSNAMAVWQIDPVEVDELGSRFAQHPAVTLCYRRRPAAPQWPYNLFVMVHAKERAAAREVIADLNRMHEVGDVPQAVLFSTRCFKQRGARLGSAQAARKRSAR